MLLSKRKNNPYHEEEPYGMQRIPYGSVCCGGICEDGSPSQRREELTAFPEGESGETPTG